MQEFDPATHEKLDALLFQREANFLVYFGTKVEEQGTFIRATKVIPHPEWSPAETLGGTPQVAPNDIGLIVLESDAPTNLRPDLRLIG